MPIYEYQCPVCKTIIEQSHSIHETAPTAIVCPKCSTGTFTAVMHQIISITSFVLKGNGWAKDGYSRAS